MNRKIKRNNLFFKESVILFGFLNGLFIAAGTDPGAMIFKFLDPLVQKLGSSIHHIFTILPFILLVVALYIIYNKAKWLGFVAVFLGFLGGLSILASWKLALTLLGVSWIIGYYSIKK